MSALPVPCIALVALLLASGSNAFTTTSVGSVRSTRLAGYLDDLSSSEPFAASSIHSPASASSAAPAAPAAASSSADFQYVPVLSLAQADTIANNVVHVCERNGFNPVTVHVLDAAATTLVMKKMDGCPPVGIPEISRAKAYGCIVNKYPSRAFRDRYTSEEVSAKFCQMTTMVAISGNQMAPFPGGILLKLGDHIIGAVGVSGAAGDEDEYCAIQGVLEANLGLTTVPEVHSCSTVRD